MERRALLGLAAAAGAVTAAARPARAGGPTAPPSTNSYVALPTATATIVRRDGRRGVMTVEIGVDAPDAALRARAEQSRPRLSAAYSEAVAQAGRNLLPGAPPDVEALITALQGATDRVLGRAGARLLIGTVMVV